MGGIINLLEHQHRHKGNAAREALTEYFNETHNRPDDLTPADHLIICLWLAGFKIVPLDPEDI
jgi:hypothetical protein